MKKVGGGFNLLKCEELGGWYPIMCGEMSGENGLTSAIQEIGFSTMTVHLFTLLCLSPTFCLGIK
jgi:hypothetical protein